MLPVEWLLLAAHSILLLLAMNPLLPAYRAAPQLAAGLVVLGLGATTLDPAAGELRRWIRELLALPLLLNIFQNLGTVIGAVRGTTYDHLLATADRHLLGERLFSALWSHAPSWPVTDLLTLGYTTFYVLPLFFFLRLVATRHPERQFVVTTFAATFFLSYVGYFALPAVGPRLTIAAEYYRALPAGVFGGAIRYSLDVLEHTKVDAFPSGHTMISLVTLALVRRIRPRWLWIYVPASALLISATVLLAYHYVTDVVIGLALTPGGPLLVRRLFPRISGSPEPVPAPAVSVRAGPPAPSRAPTQPAPPTQ